MAKPKKKNLTSNQEKFVKEVKKLKRRIKTAEKKGFDFPEDIVPESFPKRITKSVLQAIKSLRGTELLQKAIGFFTEDRTLPVSQAIEDLKQKRRETNRRNLEKRFKPTTEEIPYDRGRELLDTYHAMSEEGRIRFIRNLSDEDYELFERAKKLFGEETDYGRNQDGTGRETGEAVLPDERPSHEQDYYDEEYEQEWEEQHPEGTADYEDEIPARETADEEVKREERKRVTDEKVKEWKRRYEEQKKKKKKDREYVHDGDAIYAGILTRIEQFESSYQEGTRMDMNKSYEMKFKNMLNNVIRSEGFNRVMRRLDGYGIEIDNALETLLYDSKEEKVSAALMQLSEIILGRALSQQESEEITATSEYFNLDEADEDLEDFDIDELT